MKFLLLLGCFSFSILCLSQKGTMTPSEIAEAQLVAYNNGDITAFMEVFHEEISIWNYGEDRARIEGFENVKEVYKNLFESSPNLHSAVINRSVIGNKVLDYEYITGREGNDAPFFLIMIYEIRDNKIFKATAIRE